MLRWSLVLVVTSLGVARAEEPMTLESEQRKGLFGDVAARGVRAHAFAQLSGGATDGAEASGAVGGEFRVASARCDYLRVGGQARLRWSPEAQASAEQWASACLPIHVMEIGHHLEWDVRPSLLAPLGLRPGTNRRETVSFHWQPLRMNAHRLLLTAHHPDDPPPPPADPKTVLAPGDLVLFEVWTDGQFLWSATEPLSMRQTVDVSTFRYIRDHTSPWGDARDLTVDLFRAGGAFVQPGQTAQQGSASNVGVWMLTIENLKLGPLYASAGGGIASAAAGDYVGEYEQQVDVTKPRIMASLETGGRHVRGYLKGVHDAQTVPDGYVAIDARATAGIEVLTKNTRASLDGALARTEVLVPGVMEVLKARASTGGVSLNAAHTLTKHVQATALIDVARSFYPPAATSLDFTPRWGVQAFVSLKATLGKP